MQDVDGLNAGYAKALLEEYLENPDGVPEEWRRVFESGTSELVAAHPGLARLIETLRTEGNGHVSPPVLEARPAPEPTAAPPAVDEEFLRAVAAATELVGAYRSHGHLAARLDPLGTEPVGDPSLIWFGFLGVCQIVRGLDGNDRALGRPKEACPQPAPPPSGAPAGAKG